LIDTLRRGEIGDSHQSQEIQIRRATLYGEGETEPKQIEWEQGWHCRWVFVNALLVCCPRNNIAQSF
jgi:hypothetical protein